MQYDSAVLRYPEESIVGRVTDSLDKEARLNFQVKNVASVKIENPKVD